MTDTTTSKGFMDSASFQAEIAKLQEPQTEAQPEESPAEEVVEVTEEVAEDLPEEAREQQEEAEETEETAEESEDQQQLEAIQTKNGKMVPLGRFKEESKKRQNLHDENIRLQTQLDAMNAAIQKMFVGQEEKQPVQADEDINLGELDPLNPDDFNKLAKAFQNLQGKVSKVGEKVDGLNQSTNEYKAQQAFQSQIVAEEGAFKVKNPDFEDALLHLQQVEFTKYKRILGDDQKAAQAVKQNLTSAISIAYQRGDNTAIALYDLAKAVGYTPKAAVPKKATPNLDAINANMGKSKSGSGASSASPKAGQGGDSKAMWDDMRIRPNGRIDPKKFHEQLAREQAVRGLN